MHRCIGEHECALFLYDSMALHSFWNRCVPTGLYVSAVSDGKCVCSEFMPANSTSPVKLSSPSYIVVESRAAIPVGSDVRIIGNVLEAS